MDTKSPFRLRLLLNIIMVIAMLASFVGASTVVTAENGTVGPIITTDKHMYFGGETMVISGTGFLVNTNITGTSVGPDGKAGPGTITYNLAPTVSDSSGAFTLYFVAPGIPGKYRITATDGTNTADTHVADPNESADLDQWANKPVSSWVNGNLGDSKSLYREGDSIPYRLKFGSLDVSSTHTVSIQWDTTKGGKHAIDYLTTFDQSVPLDPPNPCLDVSGCSTYTEFDIPLDPNLGSATVYPPATGPGVTPIAGKFRLYGGTITGVSPYTLTGPYTGDSSTGITISFTTSVVNPVLAWGGHIAERSDWGYTESAVAISGSPYHTRLLALDGSGGNQDRSLSAAAVIFPGSITIIKDATPNGSTSFGFTASPSPLAGFSLVDDGTSANTRAFTNITTFGTYTVNESSIPANWSFDSVACSMTSPNGGTYNSSTTTVTIDMNEGENWTCTYLDIQRTGTLTVIKHVIGGNLTASDWSIHVKSGSSEVSGSPQPGAESPGTVYTVNAGTYVVSESGGDSDNYTGPAFSGDCDTTTGSITIAAGESKTCTLTNEYNSTAKPAHLIVIKHVINDNGGTKVAGDFTTTITGVDTSIPTAAGVESPGVDNVLNSIGSYSVDEGAHVGYTKTLSADCSGTIAWNQTKTCTLTNNDQQATITVIKLVTNDNGGSALPDDFDLTLEGTATTSGTVIPVNPGTYTAAETNLPGYTFEGFSGDCDVNGDVTVALGENKTCTLTNNDQQATITVIKLVTNDNGGSALPDDFDLTLEGTATTSGTVIPVNPGTYTAAETNLPGYTFEGFSGDCDVNGDVTVALGENKTCTLTNNDQQATITVIKLVTNDNGGSALPDDFDLTLEGTATTSGTVIPVNPGTYTAAETNLPGYTFEGFSGDCDVNGDVTVALGENKTCTLTNNDQQATITVIKLVTNDNGGSALPDDFDLTLEGTATTSGTVIPVNPGTYTAAETNLPGYTFEGFSGDCDVNGDVTVALGENKTCTLTNNDQQATITVIKLVTNDNGGSALPDDFDLTLEGTATTSGTVIPVNPGTYTAAETNLPGYTFEGFSGDCDVNGDVTVALGENKTCTLTNNDQQATITVIKLVTNDNGGSALPDDFDLTLEGTATTSGTVIPVNPGTYTAAETNLPGYTFEGFSGDCDVNGDVTVALGENKTCTLTNDDVAPQLTLIKTVVNDNGGNAAPDDFNLTVGGTGVLSGVKNTYASNTPYALDETQLTGYTFTSITGDAKCPAVLAGTVTLDEGDDITCTITNDDVAPQLTLIKTVVNDNGGNAAPDDFNLTVGGTGVLSGVKNTYASNTPYALDETQLTGYTFTSITGDAKCPAVLAGTVTLDEGDDITCTITNDDVAPQLTLIKTVVNDNGGNAAPDDFNLTVGGTGVLSGVKNTYASNTPYALDETQLTGYTFTSITGDAKCPAVLAGTVTLDEGDDITCTITNDDVAPQLTLIKTVVNDNGGNAAPDDFNLTVGGTGVLSGVKNTYASNTPYALDETQLTGYTFTSITGDAKCPAVLAGTVTLDEGDDITCTITNDDVAPQLTLIKTVVNDNGGNAAPDDFNLTVGGTGVLSGVKNTYASNTPYALDETQLTGYTFTSITGDAKCPAVLAGTVTLDEGDDITCTITNDDVAPQLTLIKTVVNDNGGNAAPDDFNLTVGGTGVLSGVKNTYASNTPYALDETQLTGYTFTSITGDAKCPAVLAGTVTLDEGDDITCTITNDDVAPQLTLIKTVVNDNGGNAAPDDFNLTVGGTGVLSGVKNTYASNTPYALDETQLTGYTFTSITGDAKCPAVLAGTVTLDEGDDITCTITNDDVAPQLTLIKTVVNDNGGNAAPDDFNLTVGGTGVLSGVKNTYASNTPYALDETQLTGYTFTSITGDAKCPAVLAGTVTLDEGDDITCTITNDDVAPQLTLIKTVVNDNGGNAAPDDFNLTVGGTGVLSGVKNTYASNTPYALDETQLTGYTFTSITGDAKCPAVLAGTVTLDEGDDITCTITNDDVAPQLTLIKTVVNDNGGNAAPDDFNLTVGGTGVLSGVKNTYASNTPYALDETQLTGYTFTSITGDAKCPAVLAGTVTLDEGDDITCTITNDDVAPQLTLIKTVVNDNGGNAAPDDFNLTVGGTGVLSGVKNTYASNTPYALDETQLTGYTFTSITGDAKCPAVLAGTVTLDEGDDITCTITNDDVQPKLKLVKVMNNQFGGTATADDFQASVSGTDVAWDAFVGFNAGAYDANETGLFGYTASDWSGDCAADGSVTLAVGDEKTCTITNSDVQPKLKLVKVMNNQFGGTATADDFQASVSGTDVAWDAFVGFNAGAYDANETGLFGYTASDWSGDCAADGSVTLAVGDEKTCTITNSDVQPKLIVIKHVINDNGGTAGAADFTMTVDGNSPSLPSFDGEESPGTTVDINAGAYSVSETGPGYYVASYSADCTGTISVGQTKTCTVTNNDIPKSQLTDTSFCPLPNNQFRLLYHLEVAPNTYRLQASNPGQYYMNGFYYGTPDSEFTMTLQIPYPFMTQEGAGNPIQVHDGTTLTSSGCYAPTPSLNGFTISTQSPTPASNAGNQIITADDYTTKQLGEYTIVTVTGTVPATGMAYVTIHLDYSLKKTGGWKQNGTFTDNPYGSTAIPDVLNQTGFGNGPVTIHGYEVYSFSRTVGSDTAPATASSYNEFKKPAGFLGFVTSFETGEPVQNVNVDFLDSSGRVIGTAITVEDGYYLLQYKFSTKNSSEFTIKLRDYPDSFPIKVLVKPNGFAFGDFELGASIQPPSPNNETMHVGAMSPATSLAKAGKWNATVTVTIHNESNSGLAGATVALFWSDGVAATCTTGANGTCAVTRNNIASTSLSLTLSVSNVALTGYAYDVSLNDISGVNISKPDR